MTDDEIAALPPILRVSDVAKLLEVSPDTVYAGVANGTIPVLRVGRAFRFNRDVILRDVLGFTGEAIQRLATRGALIASLRAKAAEFAEELRAAREGAREVLDDEAAKLSDGLKASFASLRDVGRAAFETLDNEPLDDEPPSLPGQTT